MGLRSFGWLFTSLALFALSPGALAAPEDAIPAVILKVEGAGVANVRKRSGVVESAGARGKLYVGDRVITDARSTVHLMLNDGSVLKVGFNTEFTLERVKNERKYLAWFFKLVHGSIRALVEKIPTRETHLRVETQSGTIGVRGTEFVLVYDESSAASSLFMLDGVVSFGVASCEKAHTCLEVRGGESATFLNGASKPSKPAVYSAKDLFGVNKPSGSSWASPEARMSLFRDARRVQSKVGASVDDPALQKILDDAVAEMAAAQDRAVGRTKEQREAMHDAIKNGTYAGVMTAADSYSAAQGIFNGASNGGAENLVAQVAAAKFRLGDAVRKADAAGLFLDSLPERSGADPAASGDTDRSYQLKKNVGYDLSAMAKTDREALSRAADDYRDTLSYAEALSAAQVSPGDKAQAAENDHDAGATAEAFKALSVKTAAATCNEACEDARIAHEVDVASEGSVSAYRDPSLSAAASSDAVASNRGRGGLPGSVYTRYLHRTVAGNSCFRTQQKCTMQPCSAFKRGKKCKGSENVQVCEGRQVPVRCEDQ